MTDRDPPRVPPPLPPSPQQRRPSLENFRPLSERTGSPLQQLRPPAGQAPRPRPIPGQRPATASNYPRRDEEPAGRSLVARLLLWLGLGLIGLVGTAAIALMIWSPAGLVRDQLAARIKAKTGRDLVIAGATRLSFYPSLAIAMNDVSLSAPPGMGGDPTIKMRSLQASVPLLPLLQRQVNVEGLTLRAPVIDLHVDARGRRSWDFAGFVPAEPVRYAQAGSARQPTGGIPRELKDFVQSASPDSVEASTSRGPLAALEALSLQDVRIDGGVVRYRDDRTGVNEEITAIDGRFAMANISSPADAKGSLVWRSEPIAFDVRLTSPKTLTEDRPARLALKLAGRPIDLDYEGTVTLGRAPETEGTLALKAPAVKALLTLLGAAQADGTPFNAASATGRLKLSEQAVTLSDATITLDQVSAQGSISVEQRPARPFVRGNLQIAELDLNSLTLPAVGVAPAAMGAAARPRATTPARAVPTAKSPQSIEDLLRDPAPKAGVRVQGFTQRSGWSDEPIDLSALRLVDADLKLSLGRLIFRAIKVGQTHMRVALKDRALTATFDDIQLYEGRGSGLVRIDGAAAQPAIGANFSVDGTSALPLLQDAANFDWVAGRTKATLAIGGQGMSERQIVATLQGRADVQFANGAVVGYNVPKILQSITQGRIPGLERNVAERTEFSEMAASFTILNGVATNKDLRLTSPVVRVTGAGVANLNDRTLDYTLRPKLVGTPEATTGGLEVPVKLAGTWDKPSISPDFDGVLKNPESAIDTIKQIGKQLKNGDGDAVNKAKNLLNQFLKR